MSTQPQYQELIGWQYQPSKATDPITSGDPLFYVLGFNNTSWGKFPQLISAISQLYRGLQRAPYFMSVSSTSVMGDISFAFINGVPFTFLYSNDGSVLEPVAGTFTIDPEDTVGSEFDDYTFRYKSANSANAIQKSCIDGKTIAITIGIIASDPTSPLVGSMSFAATQMLAIQSGTTSAVPLDPRTDAVIDVDTIKQYLYYWNASGEFMWNGTFASGFYTSLGSGTNLSAYLLNFSFNGASFNVIDKKLGQHYPTWISSSNYVHGWTATLLRTDNDTILEAYLDQSANVDALLTTPQTLHFKIVNSIGAEIWIDMEDVWIEKLLMNVADEMKEEETTFDVSGFARLVNFKSVDDGVPTTIYRVTP